MKKSKLIVGLLVPILLISFILVGCAGPAPTGERIVLTYANPTNAQNAQFWTNSVKLLAPELEAATNGRIAIEPHHDASLLGFKEMSRGLGSGIADLGGLHPTDDPGLFPANQLCFLSVFGYPDSHHHNMVGRILFDEFEVFDDEFFRNDIIYLFFYASGPQYFILKDPVKKLEDLNGRRIRAGGPWLPRFLTPVGMVPQEVSFGEVYESMQRGVIDGASSVLPAFRDARWYEVAKYLVDEGTMTAFPTQGCGISMRTWKELSKDDKRLLLDLAKERDWSFGKFQTQDHYDAYDALLAEGCEDQSLSDAEMDKWVAVMPDALGEYGE